MAHSKRQRELPPSGHHTAPRARRTEQRAQRVASFAAVAAADARVLVLGTMPGRASLAAGEYYAHPRNQFWSLMGSLCGAGPALPYAERMRRLQAAGVALWDVFGSCERPGSADSAIDLAGAQLNDLPALLRSHRQIRTILCNGRLALLSYQRHFAAALAPVFPALVVHGLPSTSPAHARLSAAQKLAAWRALWPPAAHARDPRR